MLFIGGDFIWLGALGSAAICGVTDFQSHRVSNIITLPSLLLAIIFHTYVNGLDGTAFALKGMLMGFIPLFIVFAIGGIGGGDVKLSAALGAWLGLDTMIPILLIACLINTIWGVIKYYTKGILLERGSRFFFGLYNHYFLRIKGGWMPEENFKDLDAPIPDTAIPFGTCLSLSTFIAWLWKGGVLFG